MQNRFKQCLENNENTLKNKNEELVIFYLFITVNKPSINWSQLHVLSV